MKMGGTQSRRGRISISRASTWKDTSKIDHKNIIESGRRRNTNSTNNSSADVLVDTSKIDPKKINESGRRCCTNGSLASTWEDTSKIDRKNIIQSGWRCSTNVRIVRSGSRVTSTLEDTSKIDPNNIIESSRRRGSSYRNSENNGSQKSSRQRHSTNRNVDSIGSNDSGLLDKRSELAITNINSFSQKEKITNLKIDVNSNNNEKHDTSSRNKRKRSIHTDNDNSNDGCVLEKRKKPMNVDTSMQQHSNTGPEMEIDTNHNNNNVTKSPSEQNRLSFSQSSDDTRFNDTRCNDSDLLEEREKPTKIDTSMQQHSNAGPEKDIDTNHNDNNDTKCPSKRKGLSINKCSDDNYTIHSAVSETRKELSKTNIDASGQLGGNTITEMNSNDKRIDSDGSSKQKELSICENGDNTDSDDTPLQLRNNTNTEINNNDVKISSDGPSKQKELSIRENNDNADISDTSSQLGDNTNEELNNNHKTIDSVSPSHQKKLSVFENSANNDSTNSFLLGKGKELLTTNIDTPCQQYKGVNHNMNSKHDKKHNIGCRTTLQGLFIHENGDNNDSNGSCLLEKGTLTTDIGMSNLKDNDIKIKIDMDINHNNKHDIVCPTILKGVPINENGDNTDSNDSSLLDNGNESSTTKIDMSSHQDNDIKIDMNINHNSKHDRSCPSKQKGLSMIDLDTAKCIVQHACVAAILGSRHTKNDVTRDTNTGSNDDDIGCEAEFEEFVLSTVSRAIRSIVEAKANIKIAPLLQPPQQSRRRPTKRRRIAGPHQRYQPQEYRGSKVKGLEHAESLHTMCSLFPLVMASTEDEENESLKSERENTEFGDHYHTPESEPEVESEHSNSSSDHDSLLPPVGTGSAPPTPRNESPNPTTVSNTDDTIVICEETLATMMPELQSPITLTSPRRLLSSMKSPLISITTNADTDTDTSLSTQTDLPPKHEIALSHSNGMLPHSSATDDEDCDYEHPLIGVFGDEGSGIISSQLRIDQYDDNDCIIGFTKVGSVTPQEVPPFYIDR